MREVLFLIFYWKDWKDRFTINIIKTTNNVIICCDVIDASVYLNFQMVLWLSNNKHEKSIFCKCLTLWLLWYMSAFSYSECVESCLGSVLWVNHNRNVDNCQRLEEHFTDEVDKKLDLNQWMMIDNSWIHEDIWKYLWSHFSILWSLPCVNKCSFSWCLNPIKPNNSKRCVSH